MFFTGKYEQLYLVAVMAEYIKQEMCDLNGTGEKPVYYRMKIQRNMDMEDFVERITYPGSGLSRGSVIQVMTTVAEHLAYCMAEGQSVTLDGIGLFIAFIGLQNAKIVLPNSSTVAGLYSLSSYNANLQSAATLNGTEYVAGTFNDVGITVLLAVIGVIFTAVLVVRNVKGNILWGILATWILGMICQACGLYVPNPANGFYSLFPDFSNGLSIPSLAPIFGKLDFSILKTGEFFVIMFAFLFVDMFDTIGTLIGVSSKANMLDKSGKLPRIKGALMADAVATCAGAVLGTSTTTTFVESASGVSEGGRTGLTAVTTAILFGLALFLSPIFLAIPSFATAPALIVVGFYMLTNVVNIDFSDLSEAIPCYICIGAMPFFYSISEGIAMGVISYVAIQILSGKAKEKKISVIMYILAVLFILKYLLL